MSVRPGFLLFLVDDPLPGANDFLLVGQGLQGMFVGEEVDVGLADRFAGVLQAEITGHRLVDANEAAVGILEINVVRQVVHQRVQQVAFLLQALVGSRKFGGAIADPLLQFRLGLAKLLFRLAEGAEKGSYSRQAGKQTRGSRPVPQAFKLPIESRNRDCPATIASSKSAAPGRHQGNAGRHESPGPFSARDPHQADRNRPPPQTARLWR